jgi:hydrogenase-4 component E
MAIDNAANSLFMALVMISLFLVITNRVTTAVRAFAIQGSILGLIPWTLITDFSTADLLHPILMSAGILLKAILIPKLLLRAPQKGNANNQDALLVRPRTAAFLGVMLLGIAFGLSSHIPAPHQTTPALLVPTALAMLLIGLLTLMIRSLPTMQVIGYLTMENGVFAFGIGVSNLPIVVELGLLFDLLICTILFGAVMPHINETLEPVDTHSLVEVSNQ